MNYWRHASFETTLSDNRKVEGSAMARVIPTEPGFPTEVDSLGVQARVYENDDDIVGKDIGSENLTEEQLEHVKEVAMQALCGE